MKVIIDKIPSDKDKSKQIRHEKKRRYSHHKFPRTLRDGRRNNHSDFWTLSGLVVSRGNRLRQVFKLVVLQLLLTVPLPLSNVERVVDSMLNLSRRSLRAIIKIEFFIFSLSRGPGPIT